MPADAVFNRQSDRPRGAHFNTAAERIWGFSRADVVGREADRLVLHDHHSSTLPRGYANPRSGQAKARLEITIHTSDGRPIRGRTGRCRARYRRPTSAHGFLSGHYRLDRCDATGWPCSTLWPTVPSCGRRHRPQPWGFVYSNAAFAACSGILPRRHRAHFTIARRTAYAPCRSGAVATPVGCDSTRRDIRTYDKNGDKLGPRSPARRFRDARDGQYVLFSLLTDITETQHCVRCNMLIIRIGRRGPDHGNFDALPSRPKSSRPIPPTSFLTRYGRLIHPGWPESCLLTIPRAGSVTIRAEIGSLADRRTITAERCWPTLSTPTRAWQPFKAMPLRPD